MTNAALKLQLRIQAKEDVAASSRAYDPELMYVECSRCGRPVLWEPGRTTEVLSRAGVEFGRLDDRCLILSHGCPACTHGEVFFDTKVVRVKDVVHPELMAFTGVSGRA
jgi:hypothetical protein